MTRNRNVLLISKVGSLYRLVLLYVYTTAGVVGVRYIKVFQDSVGVRGPCFQKGSRKDGLGVSSATRGKGPSVHLDQSLLDEDTVLTYPVVSFFSSYSLPHPVTLFLPPPLSFLSLLPSVSTSCVTNNNLIHIGRYNRSTSPKDIKRNPHRIIQ